MRAVSVSPGSYLDCPQVNSSPSRSNITRRLVSPIATLDIIVEPTAISVPQSIKDGYPLTTLNSNETITFFIM